MLPDYAVHDGAIGLDWYGLDPNLRLLLDRLLPGDDDRAFAEQAVAEFGELCGGPLARRAEITDKHGPTLVRYDEWGREVDHVEHHPAWLESKADLVRAGFTGLPWHAGRPVPAVVTAARAYLVSQAETAIYCGLGMTSGAADIVERYAPPDVRADFLRRLTSLDPAEAWEGGMFLTERQGGSDVGANTTRAVPDGAEWRLHGEKHFCSNVDAEVFIVLARPDGAKEGARGLATFIVPRLLPDGSANGFHIKRLKPKLGTVGVPTAEVELDGAKAWLAGDSGGANGPEGDALGEPYGSASERAEGGGRGINKMMEMVNGSRFGVALMGLGIHRRSFLEAAIYAAHREQWGQRIDQYPLVRETLVDLLVDLEAGLALTFECAAATRSTADDEEGRLLRRILVPLAKVRATREAVGAASQALEIFGGNGYMEDWPMARQLRDAQCHTIWEGTENICCLDVRRAMLAEGAHEALLARIGRAIDSADPGPALAPVIDAVAATLNDAKDAVAHLEQSSAEIQLLHARRFTYLLADLAQGALLLDEATWQLARDGDGRKAVVARRYRGGGSRRLGPAGSSTTTRAPSSCSTRSSATDRWSRPSPRSASALSPTAVWRISPALVAALDEHLGSPLDRYVNGTQTWLTSDGPAGATLEWRLHPVASFGQPVGVSHEDLWEHVVDEGYDPAVLWDGLECFPAYGDEVEPAVLAGAARTALGVAPDAVGLVDHDRIGREWERARGSVSLVGLLLDELEGSPA